MSAPAAHEPIGELAEPTRPAPGPRRSGQLTPLSLHASVVALLLAAPAPLALAFELGQRVGARALGALRGCPGCAARAGARLPTRETHYTCVVCGHAWEAP
ncbi:MAG: hypothetical protein ABI193_21670 [Minicystis sp.]